MGNGIRQHRWTEEDDTVTLYLYKYGVAALPYSLEEISRRLGMSVVSLKMRLANFKAIDGKGGLENFGKISLKIYERYKNTPEDELRSLALRILAKNDAAARAGQSKGQDLKESFDSVVERQLSRLSSTERRIIKDVWEHRDLFIRWPGKAVLLWEGCVRRTSGYRYPEELKGELKSKGTLIDSRRGNGPAITSFLHAGGKRPKRSNDQGWHIDHMYNGKFSWRSDGKTLHAVKDGKHFTQSAGLVSTHPVAEALADEYFCFAWLIRLESFKRFGYDPDQVFCSRTDEYGFKI